jgi:hypothetical protein
VESSKEMGTVSMGVQGMTLVATTAAADHLLAA